MVITPTTDDLDQSVSNLQTEAPSQSSSPPETGQTEQGEVESASGAVEAAAGVQPELESVGPPPVGIPENVITQLRPIGEASYGPPPPVMETVHGADDRVRIQNTDSYPWRVHASLRITAADGSAWIGTGWFISPRTLITAGHVVFITGNLPQRNGWVRRIEVIPGRNAADRPFGSAVSRHFFSVRGWTENADPEYDYGAIVLPEGSELGNQTGWIGYAAYSDSEIANAHLNISGYPGDKPDGTQWYDHRNTDSVTERKVFYDIDTAGGQSGSAAYRIVNGDRFAVGIHAYGGAVVNSATRINQRRFDNLKSWETA